MNHNGFYYSQLKPSKWWKQETILIIFANSNIVWHDHKISFFNEKKRREIRNLMCLKRKRKKAADAASSIMMNDERWYNSKIHTQYRNQHQDSSIQVYVHLGESRYDISVDSDDQVCLLLSSQPSFYNETDSISTKSLQFQLKRKRKFLGKVRETTEGENGGEAKFVILFQKQSMSWRRWSMITYRPGRCHVITIDYN